MLRKSRAVKMGKGSPGPPAPSGFICLSLIHWSMSERRKRQPEPTLKNPKLSAGWTAIRGSPTGEVPTRPAPGLRSSGRDSTALNERPDRAAQLGMRRDVVVAALLVGTGAEPQKAGKREHQTAGQQRLQECRNFHLASLFSLACGASRPRFGWFGTRWAGSHSILLVLTPVPDATRTISD